MGRLRTDVWRPRTNLRATGWLALLGLVWGTVIGLLALAVLVSAKDPVCPRVLLALYLPHALVAVGLGAALTLGETRACLAWTVAGTAYLLRGRTRSWPGLVQVKTVSLPGPDGPLVVGVDVLTATADGRKAAPMPSGDRTRG